MQGSYVMASQRFRRRGRYRQRSGHNLLEPSRQAIEPFPMFCLRINKSTQPHSLCGFQVVRDAVHD